MFVHLVIMEIEDVTALSDIRSWISRCAVVSKVSLFSECRIQKYLSFQNAKWHEAASGTKKKVRFSLQLHLNSRQLYLNFCQLYLNSLQLHTFKFSLPSLLLFLEDSCFQLQARNRRDGPGIQGGGLEEPLLWGWLGNRQVGHTLILSHFDTITLSTLILWSYHTFTLSHYHTFTL